MQEHGLTVTGRSVALNSGSASLIRTSVGVDSVHVLFDSDEWLGFPVTATFGNGDALVTQALALAALDGSDEWAAEGGCVVPWEVMREVGSVRVTFQGTDADGNRIVTAGGSPLTVVEAGDVAEGSAPAGAPTVDEWTQAYAAAVEAASAARSAAARATEDVDEAIGGMGGLVDEAVAQAAGSLGVSVPLATDEAPGIVQVGEGLEVDEEGVLSASATNGVTADQAAALANLRRLASLAFDSAFDAGGNLASATARPSALPIATSTTRGAVQPDGETVEVGGGGTLSVVAGAFMRYGGEAADMADLPAAPRRGDLWVAAGGAVVWSGSEWVAAGGDMAGYVEESDEMTAEYVHSVTGGSGSPGQGGYSLPAASATTLGGVKVGEGLAVAADGTLTLDLADAEGAVF